MKKLFFFTLILLVMSSGVWGADVKVTALPEATEGAGGDLLIIVDDPSGSATTKKITLTNLFGSTSTFTNATNCAVITPTSWGDTSIVATVRQGSFGSSDSAYLFVIDSDGVASSGYAVTFGSGGGQSTRLNNITGARINFN